MFCAIYGKGGEEEKPFSQVECQRTHFTSENGMTLAKGICLRTRKNESGRVGRIEMKGRAREVIPHLIEAGLLADLWNYIYIDLVKMSEITNKLLRHSK